ncbi:MAG: FimB/Mfa2 family fimbrial subunit [Odoribacteraceae bacterium]|jgi:hypothetical protein|nr:FimB/Mfa2 family fimbrial subunit [Odoribacteraceae bacterium]
MSVKLACLAVLALAFSSCDKKEVAGGGGTGSLEAKIVFGQANTRASSTAVPITSWGSIKQIQMFLYDAGGVVKFSDTIKPVATGGVVKRTWTTVPEGEYTMVLVANAKSSTDSVTTMIGSSPLEWTAMNVRNQGVANLTIRHMALSAFPAPVATVLGAGTKLKPFAVPAEVFMADTTKVKIASGQTTDISATPLKLKREVAMMRVRLRVNDKSQGFDNSNVDFGHADASVLVYTLPTGMGIGAGNAGGVTATSIDSAVIVGASGAGTFKSQDPTAATHNPTVINDANFMKWREIVVFPNNGGRAASNATASTSQRYYVVITGHAPTGHVLSDGTTVTDAGGALVSWAGLITDSFQPNTIREVNLNLTSGGTKGVPTTPAKEGGLTIVVSNPTPWDSNIQSTDLDI